MAAFDLRTSTAYLRGGFVPFGEANVSIASSPVLYGLAVYTVFGACWDNVSGELSVFRLDEHYRRLAESCRIMDFAPFEKLCSFSEFENAVIELLRRNKVKEDVLVRTCAFVDELAAGTRIHGLKTSLSMYITPLGEILPSSGIHAGISSWAKAGDNVIPPRAKVTGGYAGASLMKNEALRNGFDEAIALDASGHVSEATVANVFIVKNNELLTPDTAGDILDGITRRSVFELAESLGIACRAAQIDRTELYIADEMFLCGSSAGITPVLSVDRRPVGAGKPGPLTTRLKSAYDQARRGQNPNFAHWITKVSPAGEAAAR